jgi:uncharacterized membrane protein
MSQVVDTIDLDVPVEVAYRQWAQFESFPKFLDFVESITVQDATHNHWTVKFAGVEREFDAEVAEQIENERIAWNSVGGEENHAGVVTFHRLSDTQSRVALQMDWEPTGFVDKAGAAIGIDNIVVKRSLKNFKDLVEVDAPGNLE